MAQACLSFWPTTQSLRNVLNWTPPHHNLMHRIPFEIVTKPCFAHVGLLASLLGKKVSTNPGAIQCLENGAINKEIATRLAVSEDTIRFYLKKIFAKQGAANRTCVVQLARTFTISFDLEMVT